MTARDEDALICDMAQYYHILDYEAIPCRLAATLAAGLPEESRSKMGLSGQRLSTERLLLATAADRLGWLVWAQTEDGRKGRNRPQSIVEALRGESKEDKYEAFSSGAAFEAARAALLRGNEVRTWQP